MQTVSAAYPCPIFVVTRPLSAAYKDMLRSSRKAVPDETRAILGRCIGIACRLSLNIVSIVRGKVK
jgi:hypothetical protein